MIIIRRRRMVYEEEEEECNNNQMCTKKVMKSHKVPQRGPGVEELEKILREQHQEEDSFSSSVFPLPHISYPHSSPLLYPPPNSVATSNSVPKHAHLSQKLDFFHGGGNAFMGFPKNGSFLPTMWGSSELNSNGEVPKPDLVQLTDESDLIRPSTTHMLQRNCFKYSHSMMNHFPSSAVFPASSVSSPGPNHHIERPSNQRSHNNYTPMWPEEEKMVGMKRPWSLSDYTASPSIRYKVPPFSPHLNKQDQPSTSSNPLTSYSEPKNIIPREAKRRCPFEVSSNKCINQNGAIDGNILTLGPPMTPLPPPSSLNLKEDYTEFNLSLHNGSIEDRFQRSTRQGGKTNIIEKPFYSFLQTKEHMGHEETSLSLDNGKDGGHGLDLTLKL